MKSQRTQEAEVILQGAIDHLKKTFAENKKLLAELDDVIYVTPANRRKAARERRTDT